MPLVLALLPEPAWIGAGKLIYAGGEGEIGVFLLIRLVLGLQLFPARVQDFLNGRQVEGLAFKRHSLDVHAKDAGRPSADIRFAAIDGGRSFQVNQAAGNRVLPDGQSRGGSQAVERGAVGLVHAIAKDDPSLHRGRGTDRRQLQERCRFAPEDTLVRRQLDVRAQAKEIADIEGPKTGDVQPIAGRHG